MKKPEPQPLNIVCSNCGLDWNRHGDKPTVEKCIELLKGDLAREKARTAPRPYPQPYPVPYPYPQPIPYRPYVPNPYPWRQPPYWASPSQTGGITWSSGTLTASGTTSDITATYRQLH